MFYTIEANFSLRTEALVRSRTSAHDVYGRRTSTSIQLLRPLLPCTALLIGFYKRRSVFTARYELDLYI